MVQESSVMNSSVISVIRALTGLQSRLMHLIWDEQILSPRFLFILQRMTILFTDSQINLTTSESKFLNIKTQEYVRVDPTGNVFTEQSQPLMGSLLNTRASSVWKHTFML